MDDLIVLAETLKILGTLPVVSRPENPDAPIGIEFVHLSQIGKVSKTQKP